MGRRSNIWRKAAVAAALLAGACAREPSPTWFLGDLSDLQRVPSGDVNVAARYLRPGADLSRYARILIDPVELIYDAGSDLDRLHPDERELLKRYFRDAVATAVQDAYPVVNEPGPDVLRVRAAITDLDFSQSFADIGEMGQIRAFSAIYGETAMEAEFRDSLTGERLAAAVDRRGGEVSAYGGRIGTLGAARAAFVDWANLFRRRLDELHGRAR
ncbi:MAG: DUF3313 domain-containing protein [Rhodospirillaceae bacterium]